MAPAAALNSAPNQGFVMPGSPSDHPQSALLIHSFSGGPHDFYQLAPYLAHHGVSVTAVRLPGHTGEWRELAKSRYDQWWQECSENLQKMAVNGPVWIIGNSFGACLALDLAARYPQLVAGVVSLSVSLWFSREAQTRLLLPFVTIFGGRVAKPYLPSHDKAAYLEHGTPTHVSSDALYQVYAYNRRHVVASLPHVTCPVLLLHAREDDVTRSLSSQFVARQVSGPATLELVPGSHHDLLDDPDYSGLTLRRILLFLHRIGNGSSS
jgi:carboxylesterase